MRTWNLALALDAAAPEPLFLQVARGISDAVKQGRLRAGDPLPGTRVLADTLAVHRNTVIAAYRELSAEGWTAAAAGRGTFVAAAMPVATPRRFAPSAEPRPSMPAKLGFDLVGGPDAYVVADERKRGVLVFAGGLPDLRLLATAPLARAYRRALSAPGRAALSYADPRGFGGLREAVARMMSSLRGLSAGPEEVIVTRGSQMALYLVARALLSPSGAPDESAGPRTVAVESFGYRPAWEALRLAGARLVPLPVDDAGLSVDALEALSAREDVRAVYVTPHHQYPTTVSLSASRRLALLELARKKRFAVLEDDYDHEFHYDGRPVLPLASADRAGVVVYLGTLSKILAPGLRLGFVVAPAPLVERLAALRSYVDRQGDHAVERAVAELLEDGEIQRHARRVRRAYHARRDTLVDALRAELGDRVAFDVPRGGMALWASVRGVDVDAWAARAAERGAILQTARRFAFDGRARSCVRVGFAALDEREIRDGVRRLASVLGS